MSFYLNWGQEWLKRQEEKTLDKQAVEQAKSSMSDIEIEALGKKTLDFQSMNPNEDSDLPYAAASMGLSSTDYYNLWKDTETVVPDPKEDFVKKRSTSFWQQIKDGVQKTKDVQQETRQDLWGDAQLRKSTVINALIVGLNAKFQDFQVSGANSFGVASKAELERLAAEQGKELDRDYSRFVGDPETEDNEIPITWKLQSFIKGLEAGAVRSAIKKGARTLGFELTEEQLNLAPLAVTDSLSFLNTQKDFKFAETDIEVINKHFPSVYRENLKIAQDGEVREPTLQERLEAYIDTSNQLLGSGNPEGIEQYFGSNEYFQEAITSREGFKRYSIPATPGDQIRYTLTGSLGGEYSPLNNVIADIKLETEGLINDLVTTYNTKDMSDDEFQTKFNALLSAEQDKISDLNFEPKHGWNAWIGFIGNLTGMALTDPTMIFPGVGITGKAATSKTLTSVGKELDDFLKAGGQSADFWIDKDPVIQGMSDIITKAVDDGAPVMTYLVRNGFSASMAKEVVDNPDKVFDVIKDSLTGGLISDVRFKGNNLTQANDFHIQAKVLNDNFLDNLYAAMTDNQYQATYMRAGGRKSGNPVRTLMSSFKDIFGGTDVRLPSRPWAYLTEVDRAVDTFVKTGYMFSIPENKIDDLLIKFYDNIQAKDYRGAQAVFYDELIKTEGALQLRYIFGMSNNEIKEFMAEHLDDVRGFGEKGRTYRPALSDKFYDRAAMQEGLDPIARAQFANTLLSETDKQWATQHALGMVGQAMDLTINVPDLKPILRYTSMRRRLRNKVFKKNGFEESMDAVRQAADEGKLGTFYDPATPIGNELKGIIADGLDDPGVLFKYGAEAIPFKATDIAFSFISRVWMPLQLVTRVAFPLKITTDGNLRMAARGMSSIFRDPWEYMKLIWNDPNAAMVKLIQAQNPDFKPYTALTGPFRTTAKVLDEKYPEFIRKGLGALKENNAKFGLPEVQDLYERDPRFTTVFRKNRGDWEDIRKYASAEEVAEGAATKIGLEDDYIEAYADYLITQMAHDPFMPVIAQAMKKNLTDEEVVDLIQKTPYLMDEIQDMNRKILSIRSVDKSSQVIPVITTQQDFIDFVKHHKMTISNFTANQQDLMDIIAQGKIGRTNIRSIDVAKQINKKKIKEDITPMMLEVLEDLPFTVPGVVNQTKGFAAKYGAFMDALFFAVGQSEATLSRIPTFKQAYYHFLESNLVFATRKSLQDILDAHYDPDNVINLPGDLVAAVKRNLTDAEVPFEQIEEVMKKTVKQRLQVTDDAVTFVAYNADNKYAPRVLQSVSKNQIELDLNLANAESKAYSVETAGRIRLGDENTKIGAYYSSLPRRNVLVDGVLDTSQDMQFSRAIREFHKDTGKNTYNITTDFKNLIKENPTPTIKELRKVLQMGNAKYDDVAELMQQTGLLAMVDSKSGKLVMNNARKSGVISQFTEIEYHTMLDLDDIRSDTVRNMTFNDLNKSSSAYAFELHNRLLYNLLERGYLAEAYKVGLPFFEAYREVLGRWTQLAAANPRAGAQVGFAYRKGIENNYVYSDKFGEKYLIIPVGGTALENYVKTEGEGLWSDDISIEDSNIILKRSLPISALGVAGGGLLPPLGPVVAIPTGFVTRDNPEIRRLLERTIFQFGLPFDSMGSGDIKDILGEILVEENLPATGKNLLNAVSSKLGISGVDEDLYMAATTQSVQIASILYPNKSDDPEFIFNTAAVIRDNIYQLKAWDRNINPLVPKLNVLYRINTEDDTFNEWYGTSQEPSGVVWNSFVELSVIHGFYQDLREQYALTMGSKQADYEATLDVVRLLGLDIYDMETSFTSAQLQLKGKNISESGPMARTKPEYDFLMENPELYGEYGSSILYFFDKLGTGEVDYTSYGIQKGLGNITPLNKEEFYWRAATFAASLVERAVLERRQGKWDKERYTANEQKIEKAELELTLRKMFPLAYQVDPAQVATLLPGKEIPDTFDWDLVIPILEQAITDPRVEALGGLYPAVSDYLNYRNEIIKGIQIGKNIPLKENAVVWLRTQTSEEAQLIRDGLYKYGANLAQETPEFLPVFQDVFYNEVTRFGLGDLSDE
jgi:hypothetical protein